MRSGVSPAQVVATVNAALAGMSAGVLHNPGSDAQVNIKLQPVTQTNCYQRCA